MSTTSNQSTAQLCRATPTVAVIDNRGLAVRTLLFNRNVVGEAADEWVTQQHFNTLGQLTSSLDPRLYSAQQSEPTVRPNFRYQHSLSGQVLQSQSQDAGRHVTLYDVEGSPAWQQNSRGFLKRIAYDALHRVSAVFEQDGAGVPERVSERYVYGQQAGPFDTFGRLLRHYDTAGLNEVLHYNYRGQPLQTVRQLLRDDAAQSDWPADETQCTARLEAQRYSSSVTYNALDEVLGTVDAYGNQQHRYLDVAGHLRRSSLTLAGQTEERTVLASITYSASGQVLHEVAGNGVVSSYTYEPQTLRLSRLTTTRPALAGRSTLLQDLSYTYDPVGNILSISDAAIATAYANNQQIEPVNAYQYDALYQLCAARGRENTGASRQGPALPVAGGLDSNQYSNYSRQYRYDRGGNLTQMRHVGFSHYTLDLQVSSTSNRAVAQTGFLTASDVEGQFDAAGNLQQLVAGQPLAWDGRNQLQRVTQVARSGPDDDEEHYQYDGAGTRVRKTTVSQTRGTTRRAQVIYLPGLELRRTQVRQGTLTATEEELHVLSLDNAGRQQARLLHWVTGQPADIPNDQLRSSLGNQIGSSVLELDQNAAVLTQEEYYPFGGTAVWSGKNTSETQYKFVRYSGKELDATGLYHYGFRYYAPWLRRWINPDPAGTVDGLNLFRMVRNNPVSYVDNAGHEAIPLAVHFAWEGKNISTEALTNILLIRHINPEYTVNVWTSRPMSIYATLEKMSHSENAPYERYLAYNFGSEININNTNELYEKLTKSHPRGRRLESMYNREKSGAYRNYAAASDLTRSALMFEMGGIYMDVDVVAAHGLDKLTSKTNSPDHDGFLITRSRYDISNAVLASSRHSKNSSGFIEAIISNTDALDSRGSQTSWTTKRSVQHEGEFIGRLAGTLMTTGPAVLANLKLTANRANIIPASIFRHRNSELASADIKPMGSEQSISDILFRGLHPGLDGSGTWVNLRAGRRDSIH